MITASMDLRAQLSVNLKVLYGPNIEVLTLLSGRQYQALAMGFDPFVTTGTKFLHSEIRRSAADAINDLLQNSERELAKLFLAGGMAVPLEGKKNEVQTLSLRKEQDRRGSAGSASLREDFELVDTPGSSLVDENGPREVVEDDLTRGSAPVDDIVEVADEHVSEKIEVVEEDLPKIDEIPAPDPRVEDPRVEDFLADGFEEAPKKAKKDKKKGKKLLDEKSTPELVLEEIPVEELEECAQITKKKKKDKITKKVEKDPVLIDEPPKLDLSNEMTATEPVPEEVPVEKLEDFLPMSKIKKGKKCMEGKKGKEIKEGKEVKEGKEGKKGKKGKKEIFEEPAIVEEASIPDPKPEPVVEESFGWESLHRSKKGKDRPVEECAVEECNFEACAAEECHIADEAVILDPEPEVDPWSLGISKKDKKKKPEAVWDEDLIEEPVKEPEPELETIIEESTTELDLEPAELVEYESWMNLAQRKEEETKSLATLEDVKQYLKSRVLAEPAVEDEPKIDHEPMQPLEREPKPISDDDGWGSWAAAAKKKMKGKRSQVDNEVSSPSEPAPVIDHDILDEHVEAPLASEPKDQTISTPPPSGSTPPPNMNHTPRTKNGRPVVFTIRYANDPDYEPEQVMTRLVENSYEGIIETVNLYLDSKSSSKASHAPRKVDIKSGFGRNGEVDLSELEESMWPQCLEYFCQFTRNIAELTVEIVN